MTGGTAFWVLFDPRIDPLAQDERYQMNRSLRALQNGGITRPGPLPRYNGAERLHPRRSDTDLIFSCHRRGAWACSAASRCCILLTAVIIRIIHVGIKSGNYMNRLICVGIAGMLACAGA